MAKASRVVGTGREAARLREEVAAAAKPSELTERPTFGSILTRKLSDQANKVEASGRPGVANVVKALRRLAEDETIAEFRRGEGVRDYVRGIAQEGVSVMDKAAVRLEVNEAIAAAEEEAGPSLADLSAGVVEGAPGMNGQN